MESELVFHAESFLNLVFVFTSQHFEGLAALEQVVEERYAGVEGLLGLEVTVGWGFGLLAHHLDGWADDTVGNADHNSWQNRRQFRGEFIAHQFDLHDQCHADNHDQYRDRVRQ